MKKTNSKRQAVIIFSLIALIAFCSCGNNNSTDKGEQIKIEDTSEGESMEEQVTTPEAEPTEDDPWRVAYLNYIDNLQEIYEGTDGGTFTYYLIYLDDNDIPELFIETDSEASGERIVTYYNGDTVDYQLSRIGSTYIERSGLLFTDTGHMDYYPVYITKL